MGLTNKIEYFYRFIKIILNKIELASSDYGKSKWMDNWKQN
jgi:hypothetical protein